MVNNGEIIGDVALGLFVAKKINDVQQTKKAAQELGITYEEMRLRKKAAKYRSKAASSQRPRRIQKYKAKAAACDEQLQRFEESMRNNTQQAGESGPPSSRINHVHEFDMGCCFCQHCGERKTIQEAQFCGQCGKPYNAMPAPVREQVNYEPYTLYATAVPEGGHTPNRAHAPTPPFDLPSGGVQSPITRSSRVLIYKV